MATLPCRDILSLLRPYVNATAFFKPGGYTLVASDGLLKYNQQYLYG